MSPAPSPPIRARWFRLRPLTTAAFCLAILVTVAALTMDTRIAALERGFLKEIDAVISVASSKVSRRHARILVDRNRARSKTWGARTGHFSASGGWTFRSSYDTGTASSSAPSS